MKHIFVLVVACLWSAWVIGQEKEVEGYEIRGVLEGKYKANKVYLVEEDEIQGPSRVTDSSEVVNNRYTFKGPKVDCVKMYFIKSGDPDCLSPITPFFLENGVINIRSNSEFFLNAEAKGTITNDIFGFYNALIKHLEDSSMRAFLLEKKLYGERDYEYENAEFKRRTAHGKQRNLDILKDMVKMYPDQVTAPFFIYWGMRYQLPLEELKVMRTAIDSKLNEHPYTKQLDEFIRLAEFNVGSTIPDFTLPDQNGKMVSVKDFRGKYVLIDFWASWCGPCLREMPNVVKLYKECKGKNFEILGISLDKDKNAWTAAVKKNGMKWVQVCDLKMWGTEPVKLCNVRAVPYTVLIDPEGKVVALNLRGEELIAKVKEIVGKK
ncbi:MULTISPECIES: TlpA disulfide reductase family protein [Butyricimonas]|uniref:TlpA disulfide reductase family protein n=1 Tax=Butyricimonas TaxID=574697 RepID=UPI0007FB3F60|nr:MULTISPECIES: TlpA disulfide reductase family protein [Butyricimonas]